MKAPIQRVIVFLLTLRAHFKPTHGGQGTVVRDVLDDSEPQPTIGTVSKGIMEATVSRREELSFTILTGSDIW
ncbi:hypothetical protein ES703_37193 [subsurface metagenome]